MAMLRQLRAGEFASIWVRGKVSVISALEIADYPDGSGEKGPQWHLSIAALGRRASDTQVRQALADFGMVGAEEDNHEPGIARHFWRPVDPARRTDCECKESEMVVVEPDGHTWSNARAEEECRGCEYEATVGRVLGRVCPIHGREAVLP